MKIDTDSYGNQTQTQAESRRRRHPKPRCAAPLHSVQRRHTQCSGATATLIKENHHADA
jgi:hypothetical protein